MILNSVWNHIKSRIAKAVLRKKNKEDVTLPNFKLYYKGVVPKTVWYKNRQRSNGTELSVQK